MLNVKSAFKFFITICKHKWVVFNECRACGITWQGITHDLSKFGFEEFFSSAKYYCGDKSPHYAAAAENGYSAAWLHHKGCNKHHWEYWTDFYEEDGTIKVNVIPYKYVVEMICDWIGAGKVYEKDKWTNSSPIEYYYKARKGRHFNQKTETLIIHFLNVIKNNGLDEFHRQARNRMLKELYNNKEIPFNLLKD